MKTVLLRLEGPLQSWGTQGRFGIRETEREPTKSGVLGLVGAALGMERGDRVTLARLRTLSMAVRVDREGTVLRDYHTVGGGDFRGKKHGVWDPDGNKGATALTERYYLQDASFLVGLCSEDHGFAQTVAAALASPRWPLALGRRACAPTEPILVGSANGSLESILRSQPFPERLLRGASTPPRLRLVVEASNSLEGAPRHDEPESFALYQRKHLVRYVKTEFIDATLETAPCS